MEQYVEIKRFILITTDNNISILHILKFTQFLNYALVPGVPLAQYSQCFGTDMIY
jgi:hypothetical protein